MNLVIEFWKEEDFLNYNNYVLTLKSNERDCAFEKRVINTSLQCFGRSSLKAKEIAKEIYKGNYISFLEKIRIKNMIDSFVVCFLICKIKDFNIFVKYLKKYVLTIDNWASCDSLKFYKRNKEDLVELSKEILKSNKCFVRRVGVNIWFEIIKEKNYVGKCFEMLNSLQDEKEYYVNMCGAWLLAELFIKYKDETINYFKNNKTNKFIINKAVSKCRDSFRVSKEDKDFLLQFKK